MSAERPATRLWREALAAVDDLLQRAAGDRERALHELATSRPHLHPLVASLLAAERQADNEGFLEPPRALAAGSALRFDALVGPYRILRRLGEGGMGEVWLAKRDDGLYDGEVAIKTLHPYFAGGALRERFLREASLLGRLAHPHIARLLDAGVSTDGVVYLVLEYVRGVAIDVWCDERNLDVAARLRLFMDVCAAVAHAHANLIVHRDIKPSNILVTDDGQVKLLDFGVGKLVEADAQPAGELTRLTGRIFTPEYAAPEQILGQTITTATDVYALGVLLHTLLTATRPYGNGSNGVQLERAVIHDEPVLASRAVVAAVDSAQIAARRSTTPARLQRALSGDVDNIIARALCKTPSERYPSVLALADDVRRHLQHEPILAQPESLAARSRKFARRHRVGVAASVIVAIALGAGIVGVLWQAQLARTEARKATAIKDFLIGVFERNSVAHPDGARARKATAEELLAQSSQQIRTGLKDAPEVRGELLGVMAQLYSTLDMQQDALGLLQAQLETRRAELGPGSLEVAKILAQIAYSQIQLGEYQASQVTAREALRIFEALGDEGTLEHGLTLGNLAQSSYRLGIGQDGSVRRYYTQALQLIETHHPRNKWRIEMLLGLARAANLEGKLEETLTHCRRALELVESGAVDSDGIVVGSVHQTLGNAYHWLSRYAQAERHMRRAVQEYERSGGPDHSFAIEGKRELAVFLTWTGKRGDAKRLLSEVLPALERVKGPDDPELTSYARMDLGAVLLSRGELAAAEPHIVRATEAWRKASHPTARGYISLARIQVAQGRLDEAERNLQGIEETVVGTWGKGSWMHATAVVQIGALRLAQGRLLEAERYFIRARDEWQEGPDALTTNRAAALVGLIRIHLARGEAAAARAAAEAAISLIEASRSRPDMPDEEAAAHMLLGASLARADDCAAARPHLAKAVNMRAAMDDPSSTRLAEARQNLALCKLQTT